jgi:hypothetical protein
MPVECRLPTPEKINTSARIRKWCQKPTLVRSELPQFLVFSLPELILESRQADSNR